MCDIYSNGIVLYVGDKLSTKVRKQNNFLFSLLKTTVKPVLTATSEQRPPVNNDWPEFPALLNLL